MAIFVRNSRYVELQEELCSAIDECNRVQRERDEAKLVRDEALRARELAERQFRETQEAAAAEIGTAQQERDTALRERDEALTRLAVATRRHRHLLFFHIPRTGGSSLWHALAAAGAASGVPLLDLYHLARERYGSDECLYSVIAEHLKFLRRTSTVIHLHTPHNIGYFFDDPDLIMTTVVRDPIDRFISDICHLREALPHSTAADRASFVRRSGWGTEFADAMFGGGRSVEVLAELGANEPFFRYYYFQQFDGILRGRPVPEVAFHRPATSGEIKELATLVRARFAYIGRFPQVDASFHDIADLFALSHDRSNEFGFELNKRNSRELLPDRRERFGAAFGDSYQLLAAIGLEF